MVYLMSVLLLLLPACSHSEQKGVHDPVRDNLVAIFQGPEEPAAKDAIWTSLDMFKVAVIDDGTDRSGYADYVCSVLTEHGVGGPSVRVQIIDVVKLNKTGAWKKLGEARCGNR